MRLEGDDAMGPAAWERTAIGALLTVGVFLSLPVGAAVPTFGRADTVVVEAPVPVQAIAAADAVPPAREPEREPLPPVPSVSPGPPDRVLVVGDSLTADARDELAAWFPAQALVDVEAFGGTEIGWAAERLGERPDAAVVAVASGTNNVPGGWSDEDAVQLDAALAQLAVRRCAVWVLPAEVRHPPGQPSVIDPEASDVVGELRDALLDAGVHVAEWDRLAVEHADWHTDGVHHTDVGQQAYAEFIGEAVVDAC